MIAADQPVQRPRDAKLLIVDVDGRITHAPRLRFVDFLRPGDLVVANDAATLPASLHGVHVPTGADIEVRLAGRSSLEATTRFSAVVFGSGDYRMRTEDRPPPPMLARGHRLVLGPLTATIEMLLGHPRLISLRFSGLPGKVWEGLARHGRPIQYAHMKAPLEMWDVWTSIAGLPVAFEPPSAGFMLNWDSIRTMRRRSVDFATITLAAGISSTGDPALDRRLPVAEPYRISEATASAIRRTKQGGGRIVGVGTTVVRALEHATAQAGIVTAIDGIADQRVTQTSTLRIVDAIFSGTHERDSSHYQLLRAFVDDATLARVDAALEMSEYRTHEFGDSVLIERIDRSVMSAAHVERREDAAATAA